MSEKFNCDCQTTIPLKAEGECERLIGRDVYSSAILRYGYSIIRIRPYRKDGQLSKVDLYPGMDWAFCPFCGEPKD
ncbi:hypothetical protein LCGC14_0627810 [marine sediment metagenome]|uniref:Uncharacterized protein n=1 Tax=marine sediment metagenome TaxID=412755 RepID=A0A0F9TPA3_9ZZZZ